MMKLLAPAKLNLNLHVVKKLANGYHALDSLIVFADAGDQITIEPAEHFSFEVDGAFAGAFTDQELDQTPLSQNLAVRAAWALARETGHRLDLKLTLTKRLPLGAGLGGGSSDAATVIWGLLQFWKMHGSHLPFLKTMMMDFGADVPICYHAAAGRIMSAGDMFEPISYIPDIPIVLAHPGRACSTKRVFQTYNGGYTQTYPKIPKFDTQEDLLDYLYDHGNDLTETAAKIVPDIENVLQALKATDGCALSRMSGSGSCCFGFYESDAQAKDAATLIQRDNPDWWVSAAHITDMQRY